MDLVTFHKFFTSLDASYKPLTVAIVTTYTSFAITFSKQDPSPSSITAVVIVIVSDIMRMDNIIGNKDSASMLMLEEWDGY